jgi:FtsP/CotA-like multicopper oxidase with cupredoxin domain
VRPVVVIAAVVVVFAAVGGYLVFGRGGGGGGQPDTINVTVTGARMSPDRIPVHQGDRVTLNVTVDKKEDIHLHGYDIKFEGARAGDTVTKIFTADKTGSFDIEIEDGSTHLGSLEVTPR